jgi:tetrahydrodipicolinate N-succinyltransferase
MGQINKEKTEHEATKQSLQGARSEIDELRAQIQQIQKDNEEQIEKLRKEVVLLKKINNTRNIYKSYYLSVNTNTITCTNRNDRTLGIYRYYMTILFRNLLAL